MGPTLLIHKALTSVHSLIRVYLSLLTKKESYTAVQLHLPMIFPPDWALVLDPSLQMSYAASAQTAHSFLLSLGHEK